MQFSALRFHARFLAAALALAPHAAAAHSVKAGALTLTDLWTRATPPSAGTAGGYLTIANGGAEPDRLVAVASPLAERGEFHAMSTVDGVMTMRALPDGIAIPAGGTVALAPGGLHIMLMRPTEPFKEGAKVPVTLTFEHAGTVETFLHVQGIGAAGFQSGGHEHHGAPAASDGAAR